MDKTLIENLRGFEFKFIPKAGVFSPKGIDGGTRLLTENMEISDGTLICDLGCGTGAVGFTAAKMNPNGHVHLLDDHLRSVESAKENLELNNLKNVEVYLSDLFSAVPERSYHRILTNPPQQMGNEFLKEFIDECFKHLKNEGELWLVVKSNMETVFKKLLEKVFNNLETVAHSKEHAVIKAKRV